MEEQKKETKKDDEIISLNSMDEEKMNSFIKRFKEMEHDISILSEENLILKSREKILTQDLNTSREKEEMNDSKISSLESQNESAKREISLLEEESRFEKENFQKNLEWLEEEISRNEKKIEELEEYKKSYEDLKKDFEENKKEKNYEIKKLKENEDKLNKRLLDLEEEFSDNRKKLSEAEEEKEIFEEEKKEYWEHQKEENKKKEEIIDQKKILQENLAEKIEKIEKIENEKKIIEEERDFYLEKANQAREESEATANVSLRKQTALEEQIKTLSSNSTDNLQELKDNAETLEAINQHLSRQITDLKREKLQLQEKITISEKGQRTVSDQLFTVSISSQRLVSQTEVLFRAFSEYEDKMAQNEQINDLYDRLVVSQKSLLIDLDIARNELKSREIVESNRETILKNFRRKLTIAENQNQTLREQIKQINSENSYFEIISKNKLSQFLVTLFSGILLIKLIWWIIRSTINQKMSKFQNDSEINNVEREKKIMKQNLN